MFINGALGTILIGTAVATFFTGSQFSVSNLNASRWETPYHGLEAALNLHNLSLGLTVFFLARVLGILYFMNNVGNDKILERSRKQLGYNAIPFVVFFLAFTVGLLLRKGFAYDSATGDVSMENFKYLHNLVEMPVVAIIFLAGVVSVLYAIYASLFKKSLKGIWFAGAGTIFVVFALFCLAGLNHTAFYPSVYRLQDSLTIENSSSSHYTLTAMSYVSLFVPFVFAYIFYAWRAINKKPITAEELKEDSHAY